MSKIKSPTLAWRPIQLPDDIPGLIHVSEVIHPSLPESPAVFTERATLFPEGCLVLTDPDSDAEQTPSGDATSRRIYGYAISHPIPRDQPPELDSLLGSIDSSSSLSPSGAHLGQYYIHDFAILPEFRGQGFAARCIRLLLDVAERHGYSAACLISVYGTSAFWGRFGFVPPENMSDALREKIKGYGDDAVYLVREESEAEVKA